MSKIPQDLFLLMLNLSQLDSEELAKELFLDAIIEWTGIKNLRLCSKKDVNKDFFIEIAVNDRSFGGIIFDSDTPGEEDIPVLKNVAATLAVILDSLRNRKILENDKHSLEVMLQKRNEELRTINEELKSEIMERELYEQKLIENEARFRDLVENINDAVFSMDADQVITYISPVIKRITGYSPDEITGKKCGFFMYPADQVLVAKKLEQAVSEGGFVTKTRINAKNGKPRWIRISVKAVREDGQPPCFHGILTDLTELKIREERLELIAQNIDEVLWIIDASDNSLSYISPSYDRMMGHSSIALYEDTGVFLEFVHPDDRERMSASFEKMRQTGFFDGECRFVRSDGCTRWIWLKVFPLRNSDGEITNRIGLARDITEKKQNELRYSAIIQTSLVGFFLLDINADVIEANDASCSMTGYPAEELIGKNMSEFDTCNSHEAVAEILRDVSIKGWGRFESRFRSRDGRMIDVDISINNLPTEQGSFVVFVRDITGKKQLEEQVIQAQRMESIGRLAAGVAHDFNNLLSPILGYTEMMMFGLNDDSSNRPMLDEVKKAAERAKDLIRQLMSFSRRQAIETRKTNLEDIVDGFSRILRRTLRENIELEIVHDSSKTPVVADTGKIEQIIMNLAVNAQDAMPEGGKLKIETGHVVLDDAEASGISNIFPGRYATLAITDSGYGMDEETRKNVFEPFYTTKEDGKGTGLGLSTVYGIARQHNGGVSVQSEPGKGSVFIVYIPYNESSGEVCHAESSEQSVLQRTDSRIKILVVEDEEITRNVVVRILTSLGYDARCVSNGRECFELMEDREFADSIRLMISDVIMPDMKGPEIYKKLRERHPDLKAIFMSGYSDEAINDSSLNIGDFEFIQKPFSVQQLASRISGFLSTQV